MLHDVILFVVGLVVGGVGIALVFRKNNAKALAAANALVIAAQKADAELKKYLINIKEITNVFYP